MQTARRRIRRPGLAWLTLLSLVTALGCDGHIIDPGGGDDPTDEPDPDAEAVGIPVSRVWRLTPLQYERSFLAAFGTTTVTAGEFQPDPRHEGFDDVAAQNHVDVVWAELVQENAARVAQELAPELTSASPCLTEEEPEASCVAEVVDEYGTRAFRRPLDAETRDAYVELFTTLRADGNSPEQAIAAVLEAIAQSPLFLYRVEIGEPAGDGLQRLDGYSLASQLSYMLTDSPPDGELLAAAAAGELSDRAVVRQHAERLLDSPEALDKVTRFFSQYLGTYQLRDELLPKDPEVYPAYSPAIQEAMAAETDRFIERVAFSPTGTLLDLFTSPITYVDDSLRAFYGWDGAASADEPFSIPGGERAGVFMHGSVLAARSASIKTDVLHRGLYIYRKLLCRDIEPPPGLDLFAEADKLEPPDPESTERERLAYLVETHPTCGGCHTNFVSLGLSLETFDAVGVHRDQQYGKPLDPSGTLRLPGEAPQPYADAPELFSLIAQSQLGQACFAENWLSFAFGADLEVPITSQLVAAFRENDLRLRELLLLATQDDAFYLRRVEETR